MARPAPNNLEELRLISVRTNPLIMSDVCMMLAEGCHLQRLSLVEAELTDYNVAELCQVVSGARFLYEFDIR